MEPSNVVAKQQKPIITIKMLRYSGACDEECVKFLRLFPSGEVEVTLELAAIYAWDFNLNWCVENLLRWDEITLPEGECCVLCYLWNLAHFSTKEYAKRFAEYFIQQNSGPVIEEGSTVQNGS